jgi:hypothetical protein
LLSKNRHKKRSGFPRPDLFWSVFCKVVNPTGGNYTMKKKNPTQLRS